ncbi:hypothetical protein L1887_30844 [Cichorium endivia]|nr:hypothetical protein L1887_30844 [Cichorium endivia]
MLPLSISSVLGELISLFNQIPENIQASFRLVTLTSSEPPPPFVVNGDEDDSDSSAYKRLWSIIYMHTPPPGTPEAHVFRLPVDIYYRSSALQVIQGFDYWKFRSVCDPERECMH